LKRQLGKPINICRRVDGQVDRISGQKRVTLDSREVLRAIPVDVSFTNQFVYNLTWIASNKNFSYGGLFETQRGRFLIDKLDLPDFEIRQGDYIIWNRRRFDVENIEELLEFPCLNVLCKAVTNQDLENCIKRQVCSTMHLHSEVTYDKS
jgi:hypothetical protein